LSSVTCSSFAPQDVDAVGVGVVMKAHSPRIAETALL